MMQSLYVLPPTLSLPILGHRRRVSRQGSRVLPGTQPGLWLAGHWLCPDAQVSLHVSGEESGTASPCILETVTVTAAGSQAAVQC